MADKIFGAPGCNRSEIKLVKRAPASPAKPAAVEAPRKE